MIPLVAPHITAKDRDAMLDGTILLDDHFHVVRFEEEFAEFVGCAGGVAVNSGTNALMVVLSALEPTTVSLPSFTCRSKKKPQPFWSVKVAVTFRTRTMQRLKEGEEKSRLSRLQTPSYAPAKCRS